MRQRRVRPTLLILTGATLLLSAALLPVLALLLTDSGKTRELAAIVQSSVTAFAILAGGFFAAYKLEVFRDFAPHLTIAHEISHRPVSDSYVHISVSVTLRNTSRVRVDISEGIVRLYQIAPLSDADAEQLYSEMFTNSDGKEMQWPKLYDFRFSRTENQTFIEPGASHQEIFDFFVSNDTRAVAIYTYFGDLRHNGSSYGPSGWSMTTTYDIILDS